MAGSWAHVTVTDDDVPGTVPAGDVGKLLAPRYYNSSSWSLLENGGDYAEVIEQMFGMIWWLAAEAAGPHPGDDRGLRAAALDLIGHAEADYRIGLLLGGQQS